MIHDDIYFYLFLMLAIFAVVSPYLSIPGDHGDSDGKMSIPLLTD